MSEKYDITVFLGGIRPFLWENLYKSIKASCGKYRAQVIIAGPYQPPQELLKFVSFKFIKDYGGPARAAQLAAEFAEGKLITLGADDATYRPGVLERAIDNFYKLEQENMGRDVVLGIKYGEGGNLMGDHYWSAWFHPPLQLEGIPKGSPMVLNSIMRPELFKRCGGYNCEIFSTCNWGGHDLYQRLVHNYYVLFAFHPEHAMECTWKLEDAGTYNDHAPVAEADDYRYPNSDYKVFREKYSKKNPNQNCTELDKNFSWRDGERFWSRRFKPTPGATNV